MSHTTATVKDPMQGSKARARESPAVTSPSYLGVFLNLSTYTQSGFYLFLSLILKTEEMALEVRTLNI